MISSCTDKDILSTIGNHPKVKKFITDDFNFDFEPDDKMLYLVCENKGFIAFEPISCICYAVHIALMPELHGRAVEIGKEAAGWVFRYTTCQKIVAMVPRFNRLAIKIAKGFGAEEGIIKKAFSKGWKLHDLLIFGLSKEEFICQQQQQG